MNQEKTIASNTTSKISPEHKHILFTGGGSAGHVTPNIALIQKFRGEGWHISYIGSQHGIERELIGNIGMEIDYFSVATGKLRRYFSWQNFIDPFKILLGLWQAYWLCVKLKPDVIFSKGGFVSFPVVVAGWLRRIPIILHESDLTCGLANRLSYPFATKICLTFADSAHYFKNKKNKHKIVITGTPIRESLLHGDRERGLALCGFDPNKKTILVFGGSLGADFINRVVRQALPALISAGWQVVHVCGKNGTKPNFRLDLAVKPWGNGTAPQDNCTVVKYDVYTQYTYLDENFAHVMAAADLVVSRAGANSVYELLALQKPHIFIPLAKHSSRGDQIENALHFAKSGVSQVILEKNLTAETLIEKINWTQEHRDEIIAKLKALELPNSIELIYREINNSSATG